MVFAGSTFQPTIELSMRYHGHVDEKSLAGHKSQAVEHWSKLWLLPR